MPASAPSQFNPLVPYASFGWLPPGFSMSAAPAGSGWDATTTLGYDSVGVGADDPSAYRSLILNVFAAGVCSIRTKPTAGASGATSMGLLGAPSADASSAPSGPGFACAGAQPLTAASPAPSVNGRPAYWITGDTLVWEYAPRAWARLRTDNSFPSAIISATGTSATAAAQKAALRAMYAAEAGWVKLNPVRESGLSLPATTPSASTFALLVKVAEHVRYGQTTPIVFPFQLSQVPAAWHAEGATFRVSGPLLLGDADPVAGLTIGTGNLLLALTVIVTPASEPGSCEVFPSLSKPVTVDGDRGSLVTLGNRYLSNQYLCFHDIQGLRVRITLRLISGKNSSTLAAGVSKLGGAIGVFRHLRLLGTDPVNWTADPLGRG
jgi:hypothetical protein